MSTTVTQEKTVYAIDATHSQVEFIVRHLMISKAHGRFGGVSGTIELAPGSSLPAGVEVKIDAASIDTREAQRDAHLRSPDFFDVEQYPEITFLSRRVDGDESGFRLIGDLTMHGVSREVALAATFEGRVTDPWGGERVSFSAQGKVNRKDYGLNWNQALEAGGVLVGDEVRIELDVEAVLQK